MKGVQTATSVSPLTDLTAAYPAWHIWRGRDGRGRDADWHATRRRRPIPAEAAAGMRLTLSAATAESLHGLLEQQRVIEERLAGPGGGEGCRRS